MSSFGHFLDNKHLLAINNYLHTNLGNDYEADGTLDAVAHARPAEPVDQNTEEHE